MERVRLIARPGRLEAVEAALLELGACAVSLTDAGDTPLLEPGPGETPLWPEAVVEALFDKPPDREALLLRLLGEGLVGSPAEIEFGPVADRDWARAWMDRYRPMRFGRGLWVCPWHLEPDPSWPVVVRLDPGLAFGSGTHPTTALCLEWIDGADLAGCSVVDYGCGSGVLGIACALKGAARVAAVDHDPQALAATADNAARNGVGGRVETFLPRDLPALRADLVLANILAGPLIERAPRLAGLVAPGGHLVLSGILADQAEAVAEAYLGRLREADRTEKEGWMRLVFTRRALNPDYS